MSLRLHLIAGFALFFSIDILAKEISFNASLNLRSSPSFVGQQNISGYVSKGSSATVLEEKTLPSGTKAYKISLSTIRPSTGLTNFSNQTELWVYGSGRYVTVNDKSKTEAQPSAGYCVECDNDDAIKPIKDIVRAVEEQDVALPEEISADAAKVIKSLQSYRIKCNLDKKEIQMRGIQCKGPISGYPQPVRIYIPNDYVSTEQNKLNMFFHGFETAGNVLQVNKNDRNGYGDFGARLMDSRNNKTILVVPESRGEGVTYQNYFQDGNGRKFEYFLNQIKTATDSNFSETILSGHSGGYAPISNLLSYPAVGSKIKKVALYDGTYLGTKKIADWLNQNPENKMTLSWVKDGYLESKTQVFLPLVKNSDQLTKVPILGQNDKFKGHMESLRLGGFSEFLSGN